MMRRLILLGVLAGGCTAPDISAPPLTGWLPVGMVHEGEEPLRQDQPLKLATILRLAGDRPLEIEFAKAQAAAAVAEADYAESLWLPSVRPRLTLVRHENQLQDTRGNFLDIDKQNAFAGGGVALGFNPADAWFTSIAAAQRALAARLGVHATQHFFVGRAVQLYYDLQEAAASLQVAERTVVHARELVSVQEAGERAGRTLEADVKRAKAFLASANGRIAVAKADVTRANARLVGLLQLPDRTRLIPAEDTIQPIDFKEAGQPLPVLLERALATRPDVQQARSRVKAADAVRDREDLSWLVPELRVGAEWGTFGRTLDTGQERDDYFADLVWNWGFGGPANARAADARYRGEQVRLQMIERDVRTDLQVAVSEITSTKARMVAAREEVAAASSALTLVTARQKEGKVLLLEQLDAQRADTEAKINLIRAISAQNRVQFELHRLLGGGP